MALLLGDGENGKGVYLRASKAVLGEDNCVAIQPHELAEDRFAAAQLYGKSANLAGDIDSRFITNTGTIKRLTGGDLIDAQHKYQARFRFTNRAFMIVSANSIPASTDVSHGYLRRWLVLPFTQRFEGDNKDLNLDAKLAAETAGILHRGVEGLRRLHDRNVFSTSQRMHAAKFRFDNYINPVRVFVEQFVVVEPEARVKTKDVSDRYRAWAKGEGLGELSARNFNERLPEAVQAIHGHHLGEPLTINGYPMWAGILLPEQLLDQSASIVRRGRSPGSWSW
jgi:putative DNA primase/helicase